MLTLSVGSKAPGSEHHTLGHVRRCPSLQAAVAAMASSDVRPSQGLAAPATWEDDASGQWTRSSGVDEHRCTFCARRQRQRTKDRTARQAAVAARRPRWRRQCGQRRSTLTSRGSTTLTSFAMSAMSNGGIRRPPVFSASVAPEARCACVAGTTTAHATWGKRAQGGPPKCEPPCATVASAARWVAIFSGGSRRVLVALWCDSNVRVHEDAVEFRSRECDREWAHLSSFHRDGLRGIRQVVWAQDGDLYVVICTGKG